MKLVQSRSIRTRQAILDSARSLFDERGYSATSLDDVAARAQLSKATIFAHFSDKQAVLATLGIAEVEALSRQMRERAARGIALEPAALIEAFDPWLDYFLRRPDFAKLYLIQAALVESPESQAFVALCSSHEDLLIEGIARKEPVLATRADMISRGLQAHFQQVLVYRLAGWIKSHDAARTALEAAFRIWCAGVMATGQTEPAPGVEP